MAGTLAEAGTWPLQLQALRYGLMFIARLKLAPEGPSLLSQFGQRPHLQAAQLLNIYEDIVVPEQPAIEPLPPPNCNTSVLRHQRTHHHVQSLDYGKITFLTCVVLSVTTMCMPASQSDSLPLELKRLSKR